MGADVGAIVNVVNLYAMALDSRRYELFAEVFTDDAEVDFGAGAAFSGLQTLIDGFRAVHAGFRATQHMTSGHVVRVEGEAAWCGSYVRALFRAPAEGADAVFDSTGWYDDALVRTPGGWRIRRRVSRMVTAGGDIRAMQVMPHAPTRFDLLSLADEAQAGRIGFLPREPA